MSGQKNKKDDEQWMYAFFMGRSSLRACSNELDADKWTKSIGLPGTYAVNADFDGKYAAYSKCEKEKIIASCNIQCNGVETHCASSCVDLFNTTIKDGWLWEYIIKTGGGGSPKQYKCLGIATNSSRKLVETKRNIADMDHIRANVFSRLLASNSSNSSNSSTNSPSTPAVAPPVACPAESHSLKNCTCPTGQTNTEIQRSDDSRDFVSDTEGEGYDSSCSFNFTRMYTPFKNTKENKKYIFQNSTCNGKVVYSIMHTNDFVRYVLIGGVAFKMFSIMVLYVGACTTPKNEERRDNLKLSLCLATPGGCWYVCECRRGERGKEIVKETLKNAPYRPGVTGFLAFIALLGDIGLTFGLFLMSLGVNPIDNAANWSAVGLGIGNIAMNIKTNIKSKYKAKQKFYLCCPIPWPTFVDSYDGEKYGMPKPDVNGKFFWEEGYIKPPLLPCLKSDDSDEKGTELPPATVGVN